MVDQEKKIAIYFDMMDTLFEDPFPKAAQSCAGSMALFISQIKEGNYIDFEMGDIDENEYCKRFFKSPKTQREAKYSAIDFKTELMKTPAVPEDRKQLLHKLKKSYFLGLASNYGPWAKEHLENVHLVNFFDIEHISWEMGCRKPSPEYFKIVKSGTNFQKAYFIDDRIENCDAAETAGFISIQAVNGWEDKLLQLLNFSS